VYAGHFQPLDIHTYIHILYIYRLRASGLLIAVFIHLYTLQLEHSNTHAPTHIHLHGLAWAWSMSSTPLHDWVKIERVRRDPRPSETIKQYPRTSLWPINRSPHLRFNWSILFLLRYNTPARDIGISGEIKLYMCV